MLGFIRILLATLFFISTLSALEYGLDAKKAGNAPITKMTLYSERCSGSNFFIRLFATNFEGVRYAPFCHKHFPPWFELPKEHYLGPEQHYTFEGTDDYLILVIFRNPYDWIRSLQRTPWHATFPHYAASFSQFIRMPWSLAFKLDPHAIGHPYVGIFKSLIHQNINLKALNPLLDRDPLTGEPFANPLKLRTAKIKTMLKIKNRAKNVYYVNYETVRDHPQEVLAEIANIYQLKLTPRYHPVTNYKGREGKIYVPKKYDPLSPEDITYINNQLNNYIEYKIGY